MLYHSFLKLTHSFVPSWYRQFQKFRIFLLAIVQAPIDFFFLSSPLSCLIAKGRKWSAWRRIAENPFRLQKKPIQQRFDQIENGKYENGKYENRNMIDRKSSQQPARNQKKQKSLTQRGREIVQHLDDREWSLIRARWNRKRRYLRQKRLLSSHQKTTPILPTSLATIQVQSSSIAIPPPTTTSTFIACRLMTRGN